MGELSSKQNYIVGMDGGGTKTAIVIGNLEGKELFAFHEESINYNGREKKYVDQTILRILNKVEGKGFKLSECNAICIGTAGISNEHVKDYVTEVIRTCGYSGKLKIVGDHEIALAGALKKEHGIIVIAGTGSICYGRDSYGNSHRSGGFGYLIDDVGGGYYIGCRILGAIVRMEDGRGEATLLKELLLKKWNMSDIKEMISIIYQSNTSKQDIAGIAPLLSEACESQDKIALKIAAESANELAGLVRAVMDRLKFQYNNLQPLDVAIAGSVLIKNKEIQNRFIEELQQLGIVLNITCPESEPVYGAVFLAKSLL